MDNISDLYEWLPRVTIHDDVWDPLSWAWLRPRVNGHAPTSQLKCWDTRSWPIVAPATILLGQNVILDRDVSIQ